MSAGRIWDQCEFRVVDNQTTATPFRCGLCGARFTHGERVCACCPLAAGCELVRCPSCGYQFPRRSATVDALRRLWATFKRRR